MTILSTDPAADPAPERATDRLPAELATAALDLVDNMVVLTDRDGVIQYVNAAFTTVTGYARSEAIGGTPALLRSGAQDEAFYRELWETALDGRQWSGELINRRRDGSLYTDRMTVTPLLGRDGEVTHLVAVKRDVSGHVAALTAGSPMGAAHLDATGRLVYANERLEDLLGAPFDVLLGHGWLDRLPEATAEALRSAAAASADDHRERILTVTVATATIARVHLAALVLGDGAATGVVATFEDVSAEEAVRRELREREAYVRAVLDSTHSPTVVLDADGVVHASNAAWDERAAMHDLPPGSAGIGADYLQVCRTGSEDGCEDSQRALDALVSVLQDGADARAIDYPCADSWWEMRVTPLRTTEGGAVVVHTDISERHELAERRRAQATTDPLTGMLNRLGLRELALGAFARAGRSGSPITALYLDLDRFKAINDEHSHAAGDAVLLATAARLVANCRDTDLIARIGGDEFVVICEDLGPEGAHEIAERVAAAVEEPVDIGDGTSVSVGASIGVARAARDARLDDLLAAGDAAMYEEKRRRHGTGDG